MKLGDLFPEDKLKEKLEEKENNEKEKELKDKTSLKDDKKN